MLAPVKTLLNILWLVLCGFTPFTEVKSVCPSCPRPKTDQVKLASGEVLACKVIAQNDDYYVAVRFGELRAIMKSEISSIKWAAEGKGVKLPNGDQILLKNNVVLHGTIVEQQPGRLVVIRVGAGRHIVWFGQMQRLHRNGQQQDLAAAAAPASAPATP